MTDSQATGPSPHSLLQTFVERVLAPEPAVQGAVAIGSFAAGRLRPDSDIDLVVFMAPLDWYVIPAEFIWRPEDGRFHSRLTSDPDARADGVAFDCRRVDFNRLADPAVDWGEGQRAELAAGLVVFDRRGDVARLIAVRTVYPEPARESRLDEAITRLDQHLSGDGPARRWQALGPTIAFGRLAAAYDNLVAALFAYNRRWLPRCNRRMDGLLQLPWLPDRFADRVMVAAMATGHDEDAYRAQTAALMALFDDLLRQVVDDGLYSSAPIDQAFLRTHDEPGYAWNMDDWNAESLRRLVAAASASE
jgi:hypothetical protein